MFNLSSFVQKAQSAAQQLIDPMQGLNLTNSDRNPPKATLFQNQFRLPSSQNPLYEIPAELTIPPSNVTQGDKERDRGWHYAGKLHLSESYICFSTTPTSFSQSASPSTSAAFYGQTHGAGPSGNGFTFPLCTIRRVERLNTQSLQVNNYLYPTFSSYLSTRANAENPSLRSRSRPGTVLARNQSKTKTHKRTRKRSGSRGLPYSLPVLVLPARDFVMASRKV